MLTTRLGDLDAWERECVRRSRQGKVNEPLPDTCEATRKLFVGWFGTDDAVARSTIRNRILKTLDKLKVLRNSDFVSDPSDQDYAYVYGGQWERGKYERTVHIGSAFWAAATDDKTRAGTLIHELSHFHSVGYTEDVGYYQHQNAGDFPGIDPGKYGKKHPFAVYGGARAARLAIRNPSLALTNADSFEFFIEGREASPIMDEKGNLDTEGFGDFPNIGGNRG